MSTLGSHEWLNSEAGCGSSAGKVYSRFWPSFATYTLVHPPPSTAISQYVDQATGESRAMYVHSLLLLQGVAALPGEGDIHDNDELRVLLGHAARRLALCPTHAQ